MLKKLTAICVALIICLAIGIHALANEEIKVVVNGQPIEFIDQGPVIVDGRTLVPVRGVFEELNFDITWHGDIRQAVLRGDAGVIVITIDSSTFNTNGINYTLDVPAQIIGGRTMLPLRAVLESVGYTLDWEEATRTVLVSSGAAQGENTNPLPLPTPTPTSQPTVDALDIEIKLLELVNAERENAGLSPLEWDSGLGTLARAHSTDMVSRGFYDHVNPDGLTDVDRMRNAGIMYGYTGENIARGFNDPDLVFKAWMESGPHRSNILGPNYTHIGVGFHDSMWTLVLGG